MSRSHTSLQAAILAALNLPTVVHAQTADNQLEEIVVTAQKHEQSFQDVGISGSVFSGADIAKLGFARLDDIATQTPNVQIKEVVANSVPNVTIRGVGLNDYAANNNPAAGIYVDEIYLVSPAMLNFGLFDLERIEVLKGPQGTLFGRNTTAGTVNFVSRKPSDQLDGYFNLEYGDYERLTAEGAIGGPLTDTLSGRASVQTVQQGTGWQTNRLTGDKIGKIDRTAGRAQLAWKPNENLNILFNVHGGQDSSDVSLIKIDNPFSNEDNGDKNVYRSGASNHPHMNLDDQGASLHIDWSFSDTLSLTSVTGYEDFTRKHVEDRDATSLFQLDGTFKNDIQQFSQEFRLNYITDRLVLIGGAFYGEDSVDTRDRYHANDLLSLLGLEGFEAIGNEYKQDTTSAALFLHSEWKFAEDWKLTAGARYTDDQKKFKDAFTFLTPIGGPDVQVFPPVKHDYSTDNVSGKIGIDYSGVKDTLFYGSISRGFKSGGFQGQLTFDPAALQPFKDEKITAYEVGFKTRLAQNTLQLDGAAFYYDYTDMQFYGGLFDSPVGVLFGITNVGDAVIKGLEGNLWWRAAEGLDIRLGAGWLDTEITKSVVDGVATGSELPNSPKWTFNTMVRYQWALGSNLQADVQVAANYQGDLTFDIVRNPPQAREDGYWLADARAGVGAADGRWNVYLWGKNLADERYRTQVLFSSVGFGESWGSPRTYGLGVNFKL